MNIDDILGDYGAERARAYKDMSSKSYSEYAEKIKAEAKAALEVLIAERERLARVDELRKFLGEATPPEWSELITGRIAELTGVNHNPQREDIK